jgi:hypothetical protein
MEHLMDYPLLVFVLSLVVMWFSAQTGAYLRRRKRDLEETEREYVSLVLPASLTLLGLLIGFSFSMAVSRYDQRKNYEEQEANAIGTEYARAGLLPAADGARARELLKSYLYQRILFYTTHNSRRLEQINTATEQLQTDLWSVVQGPAVERPTPVTALAASGMNDVLTSQSYTQAAWWNRIPGPAWGLMGTIAICCNILVGFISRRPGAKVRRFFVLPLIVSIAFFLIADLDSPRGGVIRVHPHNLESLSQSLHMP